MVAGVKLLHTKNPLGFFVIWEVSFSETKAENSLVIVVQLKDTVVAVTNVLMSLCVIPPRRPRKNKYCLYHKEINSLKFYCLNITIFLRSDELYT